MKGDKSMLAENILYSKNEPLRQCNFAVNLTDSDLTAFFEKAYQNGTTPAEILEGFINDLICGSRTNGSDERMYAQQYFDRCCYGMLSETTFCRYLLEYGEFDTLIDALETKEDAAGEIEYYAEHPDDKDGTAELLQQLNEDITAADAEIKYYYDRYTDTVTEPETLEKGLQGIQEYMKSIEQVKGDII